MRVVFLLLSGVTALLSGAASAVTLQGTRVIYDGSQPQVSVQVGNDTALPVLLQVWADAGDASLLPEQASTPFMVDPPLQRLAPGGSKALLLRRVTSKGLPADRESVYWLNVLEIPASQEDAEERFQVNVHSRFKLLYRPPGLPGSPDEAPALLRWTWQGSGTDRQLRVDNPTPWTVNLLAVSVAGQDFTTGTGIVPARGHAVLGPANAPDSVTHASDVTFEWIDDFSVERHANARVTP